MRTKALILTAAVVAAGVASSMAQSNVYSLNVVGYVNVTVPPGFSMLANPLDDGNGNYLTNIIDNSTHNVLPNASKIYIWNLGNANYDSGPTYRVTGNGWRTGSAYPTNQIPPGTGFFLFNSDPVTGGPGTNASITFVGSVVQSNSPLATVSLPAGLSLIGNVAAVAQGPGSAAVGIDMALPVAAGDKLYLWNNPGGGVDGSYTLDNWTFRNSGSAINTWVNGSTRTQDGPVIPVGQGFWVSKQAGSVWASPFVVQ